MTLESLRFQVGAGDGLVARFGGRVLVAPRWTTDQTKVLDALVGGNLRRQRKGRSSLVWTVLPQ